MKSIILSSSLTVLGFAAVAAVASFPQSPVIYYGLVRDEYGSPLKAASDVRLDLVRNNDRAGAVCATSRVGETGYPGMNYRLSLEIDSAGPVRAKAAVAGESMYIKAIQGGASINLSPDPVLATPAQGTKVRMDFTIGEDFDHDGMPDSWEEWQLDMAGRDSSPAAILAFKPEDDADGDGMTNYQEYLAGTDPFLATDLLKIESFEVIPGTGRAKISFLTAVGRKYRVVMSQDLAVPNWSPVAASRAPEGELGYESYAGTGHPFTVYVDARVDAKFFRIAVN